MAGNKIYKGQSALRFEIPVGEDLTGAIDRKLRYYKPGSSVVGEVNCAVLGDATDGVMYFDVPDATFLDTAGKWKMWGHVKFSDGRVAPGLAEEVYVYEEGEV